MRSASQNACSSGRARNSLPCKFYYAAWGKIKTLIVLISPVLFHWQKSGSLLNIIPLYFLEPPVESWTHLLRKKKKEITRRDSFQSHQWYLHSDPCNHFKLLTVENLPTVPVLVFWWLVAWFLSVYFGGLVCLFGFCDDYRKSSFAFWTPTDLSL